MPTSNASSDVTVEKELPGLPQRPTSSGLRQSIRRVCIHLWIWELLSLLLCMSCVGVIIIILLRYDNKPLPAWNYGLTINGVISVLAGIAKASMILPIAESISQLKWHWFWNGRSRPIMDFERFDTASRGPWGCLILLVRPRQWGVVTIGACITVLALLMEPSLQFILSYPLHAVSTGEAYIPRSLYYEDISMGKYLDAQHANGTVPTYTLGSSSKNGLYNVLYGGHDQSTSRANPICPSGNCTWSGYSSLGVCSSCTNVTSYLHWVPYGRSWDGTGWTLPTGQSGYASYYWYWMGDSNLGHYWSLAYNGTVQQNLFNVFYFENEEVSVIGSKRKPKVYECVLYLCVKTYSARVAAGVFSEHIESTWPGPHEKLERMPNPYLDTTVAWNETDLKNISLTPPGDGQTYEVNPRNFVMLKGWLSSILGYSSIGWSSQDARANDDHDLAQAINEASKSDNITGSYPVDRIMNALADSFTLAIRKVADPHSAAIGSARENRTFVKSRWWFAVLPIGLVALTCAFMVTTLTITARHNVPIWKSSALASLAHGLERASSESIISHTPLDEIERNAESRQMTMRVNEKQWRLAITPETDSSVGSVRKTYL